MYTLVGKYHTDGREKTAITTHNTAGQLILSGFKWPDTRKAH